jgi:predicted HicB family RNase H-like nuclease
MSDTLKYKDYQASLYYSEEDEVFHGKILGINDLVTFEGRNIKDLKNHFAQAVDDYLETCTKLGRSPDKVFRGSFNVRLSPVLHKQAASTASTMQMTLNEFVKIALSYAVAHREDLAQ